jgi:peroxidase
MTSVKNFGIRKRELISILKSMVEASCPQQVSCADLLILAAREAVAMSGGPRIKVPLGRRDSSIAPSYELADALIPPATIGVNDTLHLFTSKGMTIEESVAIIGNMIKSKKNYSHTYYVHAQSYMYNKLIISTYFTLACFNM